MVKDVLVAWRRAVGVRSLENGPFGRKEIGAYQMVK